MTPPTCLRCDRPPYRRMLLCRDCLEAVIFAAPEPRSRRMQDALNAQRSARKAAAA